MVPSQICFHCATTGTLALSILESEVLKSPTITIKLSIPPFESVHFCFMPFEALLGAYIFLTVIILLQDLSLILACFLFVFFFNEEVGFGGSQFHFSDITLIQYFPLHLFSRAVTQEMCVMLCPAHNGENLFSLFSLCICSVAVKEIKVSGLSRIVYCPHKCLKCSRSALQTQMGYRLWCSALKTQVWLL